MNEQLRVSMPPPQDARSRPRLSIVAPCYNEEAGLEEFHRRMSAAANETVGSDYELILVNDGSATAPGRSWSNSPSAIRNWSRSTCRAATVISAR